MRRLILVGNGFDLAHNLKTSYNNFIVWYIKSCFNKAVKLRSYEDELISITKKTTNPHLGMIDVKNVDDLIDEIYKKGFSAFLYPTITIASAPNHQYDNPFIVKYKSKLIGRLLAKCDSNNWVDVENEFYDLLKAHYNETHIDLASLEELNVSLKAIIGFLGTYLTTQKCDDYNNDFLNIFNSLIKEDDILQSHIYENQRPTGTLILNFNYTNTLEFYRSEVINGADINYIHGRLLDESNPLIFGFGDELDDSYKKMELSRTNQFFAYIKSFWYFKTSNYHNLIRFLEATEYQVYILGHSCGLSDRTLLNMIFEHQNCKSIKIFYHGSSACNNYERTTQEISRHFKDKVAMRRKIVPFSKSEPMPQVGI